VHFRISKKEKVEQQYTTIAKSHLELFKDSLRKIGFKDFKNHKTKKIKKPEFNLVLKSYSFRVLDFNKDSVFTFQSEIYIDGHLKDVFENITTDSNVT